MKHIAEFAVERGRDVVYVIFRECIENGLPAEYCEGRDELIERLLRAELGWEPCRIFPLGSDPDEDDGCIFVDVPYSESDPQYAEVSGWFDSIAGKRDIEGGELCFLTLAKAKVEMEKLQEQGNAS